MTTRRALLTIIAAFAIAVLLVDPRGNFPLDDDWGVGFTTFTLLHTGRIEFTPFASATAYLQFAWGALWAALFGETFTVLRCAVLSLSLGSTLILYALLRRRNVTPALALLGAAALLFHPIFFWASFTSMTHVPFVFLSLVALSAFVRAWEHEGVWLAIAFVAVVATFFTRQFAVLDAIAPLIVAIVYRRKRIAATYAAALATFGLLVVSGVLVASQKELVLHRPSFDGARVALRASHYVFFNWQNAALFCMPLLLLVLLARRDVRLSRVTMAFAAAIFTFAAWRMTQIGMPIPYMNSGNVFTDFGLGPPTLRDVFTMRMPHPYALSWSVKVALMFVTTIAAVLAAGLTAGAARVDDFLLRFCAVYLACGTAVVAFMKINFDRYSLDAAWPLVVLLVLVASRAQLNPIARAAAALAMAVMVLLSISGTAEYLSWNRARWEAFTFLRANGVTLDQMDGGYEINSLLALREGHKDLGKPGVGVIDDRFIIAFNRNVPGYVPVRAFPYSRWLGWKRAALWVQQRN